jgi:hypothetical protein
MPGRPSIARMAPASRGTLRSAMGWCANRTSHSTDRPNRTDGLSFVRNTVSASNAMADHM